ncbi:MAG: hypothetical protein WCE94_03465 [Candidatus Methanoperedens sp.]
MDKMQSFLKERFDDFNNKYFEGKLTVKSIVFISGLVNYDHFAGYSPDHDQIFIAHKVLNMPIWVLDYLIMHEMTHVYDRKCLHEKMTHSKEFWAKVGEYEHTEWARGYLEAYSLKFRFIDFLGEYLQWRIRSFWTFLELKTIGKTYYTIYD